MKLHPSLLPPLLEVDVDLFLWFSYQAMDLGDLLTFHWENFEPCQQYGGKHTYFKVREEISWTLPTAGDTKRTKFEGTLAVGGTCNKTVRIPPGRRGTATAIKRTSLTFQIIIRILENTAYRFT